MRLIAMSLVLPLLLTNANAPESRGPVATAPQDGEPIIVKIATQAPERGAWAKTFKGIVDDVKKVSNGKVIFKPYYSGVHGPEGTVMQKVRAGRLAGSTFLSNGLTEICPNSMAIHLPLLFRDQEEVDYAFPKIREQLEAESRSNGYEVVGWPQLGFSFLYSKVPVKTIQDLREAKPWLIEDDLLVRRMYEALEVTAITIGVTDVLTSLETGIIDTVFSPPVGLIALQWHTRVDHMLDVELNYSFGILAISNEKWNEIPAELRPKIKKAVARRIAALNRTLQKQNTKAVDALVEKLNYKVLQPTEAAKADFRKVTDRLGVELAAKGDFELEFYERVTQILDEYRAKNGGEAAGSDGEKSKR